MNSERQEMYRITSLSVIIHYVHYCNPNLKTCHHDTRLCVVVNVVYKKKYTFLNTIMAWLVFKNWNIKAKIPKAEGLGEKTIAYMKHIKVHSCHMGVISMSKHLIWKSQQCVIIHSQIIHYNTGNVYSYRAKCPSVNLPDQETDDQYSNTRHSIRFHIYHIIACCTTYGRLLWNEKNFFRICK